MTRIIYAQTITPELMQPMLDLAFKYQVLQQPISAAAMIAKPA